MMSEPCDTVEEMLEALFTGHPARVMAGGPSMWGYIEPGQIITIAPIASEQVKTGTIVLGRIDRKNTPRYMTHLVKNVLADGFLICNARERKNRVASRGNMYGVVIEMVWLYRLQGLLGVRSLHVRSIDSMVPACVPCTASRHHVRNASRTQAPNDHAGSPLVRQPSIPRSKPRAGTQDFYHTKEASHGFVQQFSQSRRSPRASTRIQRRLHASRLRRAGPRAGLQSQ